MTRLSTSRVDAQWMWNGGESRSRLADSKRIPVHRLGANDKKCFWHDEHAARVARPLYSNLHFCIHVRIPSRTCSPANSSVMHFLTVRSQFSQLQVKPSSPNSRGISRLMRRALYRFRIRSRRLHGRILLPYRARPTTRRAHCVHWVQLPLRHTHLHHSRHTNLSQHLTHDDCSKHMFNYRKRGSHRSWCSPPCRASHSHPYQQPCPCSLPRVSERHYAQSQQLHSTNSPKSHSTRK